MLRHASTSTGTGRARRAGTRPRADDGTTVLVASRRGLVQAGMAMLLQQLPQYRHVATACGPEDLARAMREHLPDVLVLDQELAEAVGGDCRGEPATRVLLISNRPHAGIDAACGENCACGLVTDSAPLRHIRAALKIIGGCNSGRLGDGYCTSCPLRGSLRPPKLPLSTREHEVFLRIGLGESNQQIAAHFGRSVKTIETHRENIKRKLGLDNGAALLEAAMAWRRGDAIARTVPRPAAAGTTPTP